MKTPSIVQAQQFIIEGYEIDEKKGVLYLNYSFDHEHTFCEKIDFGQPIDHLSDQQKSVLEHIFSHLAIAAGVSYYKALVPDNIVISHCKLTPEETSFFQKMYRKGLGEFAYRNKIDLTDKIRITSDHTSEASLLDDTPCQNIALPRKSAVLIGGGKDSMVSVEVLRAGKEPMVLLSVNPRQPIYDCAADSGFEMIVIKRTLDSNLFALNEQGAFNGHVPITGIISFISVAAAIIHGFDTIILSNERSANEGNVVHDGEDVNHQYSKSLMFEQDFSDHLTTYLTPSISYFSLLRPLSELRIAREFSRTERYDRSFTSCNKAFRITNRIEGLRWCGDCAKCRFVFLVLATTTGKERLERIFGKNMLDDIKQLDGYKELVGFHGHKPWDCVGEILESLAAVHYLTTDAAWHDTTIITALAEQTQSKTTNFDHTWESLLTLSEEHRLPAHYKDMLNDYLENS